MVAVAVLLFAKEIEVKKVTSLINSSSASGGSKDGGTIQN